MNDEWLDKIIKSGKEVTVIFTLEDAYNALYEICDTEHAGCTGACPVYAKCIEDGEFTKGKCNDCPYFKNGLLMFERLRK